MIVIAYYICVA